MYQLLMICFADGAIDPPHFHITGNEAQHALLHYTGMTEHPQLLSIERSLIHDMPPLANVMEPLAASAAPAIHACASSPAENALAVSFL